MAKRAKVVASAKEHPADRKMREEGEEYGMVHAEEFIAAHPREVAWLFGTYADGAAQEVFDSLRERFWGGMWKPTSGRWFKRLKK